VKRTAHIHDEAKAAEDWPHSKTLRKYQGRMSMRQVLECGQSSAALAQTGSRAGVLC